MAKCIDYRYPECVQGPVCDSCGFCPSCAGVANQQGDGRCIHCVAIRPQTEYQRGRERGKAEGRREALEEAAAVCRRLAAALPTETNG